MDRERYPEYLLDRFNSADNLNSLIFYEINATYNVFSEISIGDDFWYFYSFGAIIDQPIFERYIFEYSFKNPFQNQIK